jgi:hypothetical protein
LQSCWLYRYFEDTIALIKRTKVDIFFDKKGVFL